MEKKLFFRKRAPTLGVQKTSLSLLVQLVLMGQSILGLQYMGINPNPGGIKPNTRLCIKSYECAWVL